MRAWLIAGCFVSATAVAGEVAEPGDVPDNVEIRYQEKTELDFTGVKVDGEVVKPQVSYLGELRHPGFNPMIRLRETWTSELANSVDEVK